jgi:hypothetical protein
MTDLTTVAVRPEQKEWLDDIKRDGESYADALERLRTDETLVTEERVRELIHDEVAADALRAE